MLKAALEEQLRLHSLNPIQVHYRNRTAQEGVEGKFGVRLTTVDVIETSFGFELWSDVEDHPEGLLEVVLTECPATLTKRILNALRMLEYRIPEMTPRGKTYTQDQLDAWHYLDEEWWNEAQAQRWVVDPTINLGLPHGWASDYELPGFRFGNEIEVTWSQDCWKWRIQISPGVEFLGKHLHAGDAILNAMRVYDLHKFEVRIKAKYQKHRNRRLDKLLSDAVGEAAKHAYWPRTGEAYHRAVSAAEAYLRPEEPPKNPQYPRLSEVRELFTALTKGQGESDDHGFFWLKGSRGCAELSTFGRPFYGMRVGNDLFGTYTKRINMDPTVHNPHYISISIYLELAKNQLGEDLE